jgi:single-strand DNA-binding protein
MYQKVIIIGHLGGDPQMRYMPDGTAVTSFSVATNHSWTDKQSGQKVDETTWFRISVWGRQAEVVNQYLSKGRQVFVEGRLTPDRETGNPRTFTRQDGTIGTSFEVRADTVRFIGGRGEGGDFDEEMAGSAPRRGKGSAVEEEDDIPF